MVDKIMIVEVEENKAALTLRPKTFSTGSKGFMAFGKIIIDGKRYQVCGNIVEIGSRPTSKKK